MNPNPSRSTGRFKTRAELEQFVISNWVQSSMTSTDIAKKAGASCAVVTSILQDKKSTIEALESVYEDTERFLLAIANQPHYRVPKEQIIRDAAEQLISAIPEKMRGVPCLLESTYGAVQEAWVECGFDPA